MAKRWNAGESKATTKALASHRSGRVGHLREIARCFLLEVMGWDCREVRPGEVPSYISNRSLSNTAATEKLLVAKDALLELGYEAAADELSDRGRYPDLDGPHPDIRARDALELLEAGPPSIFLDTFPIATSSLRAFRQTPGEPWPERLVLVGKDARGGVRSWVVFVIGNGRYQRSKNFIPTHNTHHKSLKEARGYWGYEHDVPSKPVPVRAFFQELDRLNGTLAAERDSRRQHRNHRGWRAP